MPVCIIIRLMKTKDRKKKNESSWRKLMHYLEVNNDSIDIRFLTENHGVQKEETQYF